MEATVNNMTAEESAITSNTDPMDNILKRMNTKTPIRLVEIKKSKSFEEGIQEARVNRNDSDYRKFVHEGKRLSIEQQAQLEEENTMSAREYNKKVAQLDKALNGIDNPELADYIIICSTKLFGKLEPEEIALIREYKRKFGNVKTIKEHLNIKEA